MPKHSILPQAPEPEIRSCAHDLPVEMNALPLRIPLPTNQHPGIPIPMPLENKQNSVTVRMAL
jgi:hypothetical protein